MAGISGANSCKGVSIFSFPSIFQANCDTDFVGAKSVSDKKETSWKSEHSQRPKVNLPILESLCRCDGYCCVWWMESFSVVHNQFKCEDSSPLDQPSPCAEKSKINFPIHPEINSNLLAEIGTSLRGQQRQIYYDWGLRFITRLQNYSPYRGTSTEQVSLKKLFNGQ